GCPWGMLKGEGVGSSRPFARRDVRLTLLEKGTALRRDYANRGAPHKDLSGRRPVRRDSGVTNSQIEPGGHGKSDRQGMRKGNPGPFRSSGTQRGHYASHFGRGGGRLRGSLRAGRCRSVRRSYRDGGGHGLARSLAPGPTSWYTTPHEGSCGD